MKKNDEQLYIIMKKNQEQNKKLGEEITKRMLTFIDTLDFCVKGDNLDEKLKEFSLSLGFSSHYFTKDKCPLGIHTIESIEKVYPQLNIAWVLTGSGEMLLSKDELNSVMLERALKEQRGSFDFMSKFLCFKENIILFLNHPDFSDYIDTVTSGIEHLFPNILDKRRFAMAVMEEIITMLNKVDEDILKKSFYWYEYDWKEFWTKKDSILKSLEYSSEHYSEYFPEEGNIYRRYYYAYKDCVEKIKVVYDKYIAG